MIRSALIGALIALAMLLPPLLHFLTGPLGPLVGGFFAGSKARSTPGKAPLIGLLMGAFMVAPMLALLAAGSLLEGLLPSAIRDVLAMAAVVIVLYTGVMGSAGALLGGYLATRPGPEGEAGVYR